MRKNVENAVIIASAAIGATSLYAAPPSTDPRYFGLRDIMREYVQNEVKRECQNVEGYSYEAYEWSDYEIHALEAVLFDIINHTANYCKPPELTGMHAGSSKTEDGIIKSNLQ